MSPNAAVTNPAMLDEDEECGKLALSLANAAALPMILKSAIELNVLDIIQTAAGGDTPFLSAADVAAQIPSKNPNASVLLDRMLRFLASHKIVTCKLQTDDCGKSPVRLYGAAPVCKYLTKNEDKGSLGPLLFLHQDKVMMESWFHLNDYILEGTVPFVRAHGMTQFDYNGTDERFNHIFNQGMAHHTILVVNKILEKYKGFQGIKTLVDVGGNIGINLHLIVSKYPHIKAINYDLPHALADSPTYPGVENVPGDMFESVPTADAILMKWVPHDWGDDYCLILFKNCHKALPDHGKLIIVEAILPVLPENNISSQSPLSMDQFVLVNNQGGKERTKDEIDELVTKAGFTPCEPICCAYGTWLMECRKK